MRLKTAFAALVMAAAVGITGCSSSESGTPQTAGAPTSAEVTKDTGAEAPAETSADAGTPAAPGASKAEDTPAETDAPSEAGSSEPGISIGGKCGKLLELQNKFNTDILGKASSGKLTEADVNAVFTEEAKNAIPDEVKSDYAELERLSREMVGKQPAELIDTLQELQKVLSGMVSKLQKACGGG